MWGLNKLYLLMEKQHNRGQDGAGFAAVKLNVEAGYPFLYRNRSIINQPIAGAPGEMFTFSAVEQRIEWGLLLGYRIMRRNNAQGITIDAFVSADAGYRGFDVDPNFTTSFEDVNQSRLSTSFHFGLNFGRVFSFK
jgi:hypothetical protein